MHDIQDSTDERGVALDHVGVTGLRQPVLFDDGHVSQDGIADLEITVQLPAERRGTHMSRMVQIADEHLRVLVPCNLPAVLKEIAHRLDAESVALRLDMPFATRVRAPATGVGSWQPHDLTFRARANRTDGPVVETTITTDVTSLCPCSKAISDYGAHNQRSQVTVTVRGLGDDPYPLRVCEAVTLARAVGSAPVFPAIKRPDERVLTMQAFDRPAFVEDMARDLALACDARQLDYRIHVRNVESIHSHDAIARLGTY
jgi:GTP cyclohydrolase I